MGSSKKMQPSTEESGRIVDTPQALEKVARNLAAAERVGVDLEADSMFHYQEKVCLLQLATDRLCRVVDPLSLESLAPLAPVFADAAVQKVFHGADYDVRSLYRDFRIEVNNLFDTQIASRFLGCRETSLEAVLNERFGVTLDKRFQRKDWSKRPLPDEMIEYAARDSLYLPALARQLEEELRAKDRLEWVREECALLSLVRPAACDGQPLFMNFKGAGRLGSRSLAVLEALLVFRREIARQKDRPLFKVVGNKVLLSLATAKPKNLAQIERLAVLSPKQLKMYGPGMLAAITAALALPAVELPVYPRKRTPALHPAVPERVKALRAWRDKQAAALKIDPTLLFTKAMLVTLAADPPLERAALKRIQGLRAWQRRAFGADVIRILKAMR